MKKMLKCLRNCFKKSSGWCSTGNIRALWLFFALNTLFATSQMIGAIAANSLSMLGDSGSMLVDSLSYLVNIYAEKKKITQGKAALRLEVGAAFVSSGLLITVTAIVLEDARKRLCCPVDDEEEVNGAVVFGFALCNFIIDLVMCGSFFFRRTVVANIPLLVDENDEEQEQFASNNNNNSSSSSPPSSSSGAATAGLNHGIRTTDNARPIVNPDMDLATGELVDVPPVEKNPAFNDLNMNAAFLHVFADTLRTLASLISGGLVWFGKYDSIKTDAIASVLVSATIIFAVILVLYETAKRYRYIQHLSSMQQIEGISADFTTSS